MEYKWGFLRETKDLAQKAGIDADTGIKRTGLDEYLKVIFPEIDDNEWFHDKPFAVADGEKYKIRPDYRCDKLKLIIEFDGLPHYQNPDRIIKDRENTEIYESCGFKVVRIPYFIQLTNEVVKIMFDREVDESLFCEKIPSMGLKGRNTPAYCCCMGVERMAEDFLKYHQQMEVNVQALENANNEQLTGVNLLRKYLNEATNKA